jgi:Rrf2 family protein
LDIDVIPYLGTARRGKRFKRMGVHPRTTMNTQFVIASHTLIHLSLADAPPVSSEDIAASVDTNPAFIRQILGTLRDEELVTARRGPNGGFSLAKDPSKISLLDVFQVLDSERIVQLPEYNPHPICPIGSNLRLTMYDGLAPAEDAVKEVFSDITIDELAAEIRTRETNRALDRVVSSENMNE